AGSAAASATPPAHAGSPAIVGTEQVGQVLAATTGSWSGTTPIKLTYQWQRCDPSGLHCSKITGATAVSYTLAQADRGRALRVTVTAKNRAGSSSSTSAPTAVIKANGSGFDFSHFVSSFALTWLPVLFFALMCVVVWLLWR